MEKMRIFQWNPGEYRRFSVGNHISEAAHGGDEPDPEAVVDLGAQIIDIDVHDVGILAGLSEDAGERVLSGYGLPAVVEQKAKQIELPFCQLDFLSFIICGALCFVERDILRWIFPLLRPQLMMRSVAGRDKEGTEKIFDDERPHDRIVSGQLLRRKPSQLLGISADYELALRRRPECSG